MSVKTVRVGGGSTDSTKLSHLQQAAVVRGRASTTSCRGPGAPTLSASVVVACPGRFPSAKWPQGDCPRAKERAVCLASCKPQGACSTLAAVQTDV